MSKVIVLYREGDEISIVHPAPKGRLNGESESNWLNRVLVKSNPDNLDHEIIDISEFPENRDKRDKWRKKKGQKLKIQEVA